MTAALKSCCANLYELPITSVLLGPSFHPGGPRLTRRLGELALISRESHVLDVASGTGESARVLNSHFGCRVTGVDLSMKNVARASLEASSRLQFVVGDAEDLPIGDAAVDVVFCECALCTFPQMDVALAEMRRVLEKRGRIAISDIVLTRAIPPELDNVMSHVLCIRGALSSQAYCEALERAGFSAIRHRDASDTLLRMVDDIEQRIPRARALFDDELQDAAPHAGRGPGFHSKRRGRFMRSSRREHSQYNALE